MLSTCGKRYDIGLDVGMRTRLCQPGELEPSGLVFAICNMLTEMWYSSGTIFGQIVVRFSIVQWFLLRSHGLHWKFLYISVRMHSEKTWRRKKKALYVIHNGLTVHLQVCFLCHTIWTGKIGSSRTREMKDVIFLCSVYVSVPKGEAREWTKSLAIQRCTERDLHYTVLWEDGLGTS